MRERALRIEIVTPAPRGSRAGNRVTAQRWANLLRSLGHRVRITNSWKGQNVDVLIALHARKSYQSIRGFREARPDGSLVVALTGTDVYRDIHQDPSARRSLQLASRLIVLQQAAIHELPFAVRDKARVILQSAQPRVKRRKTTSPLRLVVVGHLREEKDPFRVVEAVVRLPGLPVEVRHAGKPLQRASKTRAHWWMAREPRYRWVGEVSASRAKQMIADSDALVLTSVMEGGANVISEAVVSSVPVLASRISSSVALLGQDYDGYFGVGNSQQLAELIRRFVQDPRFRRKLRRHVRRLGKKFDPRNEREAWRKLLAEMEEF